jgi:hypothetical protein
MEKPQSSKCEQYAIPEEWLAEATQPLHLSLSIRQLRCEQITSLLFQTFRQIDPVLTTRHELYVHCNISAIIAEVNGFFTNWEAKLFHFETGSYRSTSDLSHIKI